MASPGGSSLFSEEEHPPDSEEGVESDSTSNSQQPSVQSLSEVGNDPWPYLKDFLDFLSCKNSKNNFTNLEYRCKMCKQLIKANSSSKSNITHHMKALHPGYVRAFEKVLQENKHKRRHPSGEDETQPSISTFIKEGSMPKRVTQSVVDDKVMKFVVNSAQPFTIVHEDSFVDLVKTLQPGRHVMSYETLMGKLGDKYKNMRAKIRSELEEVKYVCVTGDIWTEARRSFLTDGLERKSYALACKRVKGLHSYDVVAKVLMEVLEDMNIQFKVTGIVTDNGSNFCKAFRIFSQAQSEGSDLNDGEEEDGVMTFDDLDDILGNASPDHDLHLPQHFRCSAHTLSLVATKDSEVALKSSEYARPFRSTFAKLQAVWNLYNRSSKFADSVQAKFNRCLVLPNATHWNSTYDAVKRIKELSTQDHQALQVLLTEAKVQPLTVPEDNFINEFLQVMEPLAEALDYLQGEKYMFLGYLLPTLIELKRLLAEGRERVTVCKHLATALVNGVDKRFASQFEDRQMIVAAIYLPAFKMDWIQDDEAQATARHYLLQEMEYVDNRVQDPVEEAGDHARGSGFFSKRPRRRDTAEEELARFIADTSEELQSVLAYRRVREVFLKYNTILPSSASSERLFSKGKIIFRPNRHRMKDASFEMQLLLNVNGVI